MMGRGMVWPAGLPTGVKNPFLKTMPIILTAKGSKPFVFPDSLFETLAQPALPVQMP